MLEKLAKNLVRLQSAFLLAQDCKALSTLTLVRVFDFELKPYLASSTYAPQH